MGTLNLDRRDTLALVFLAVLLTWMAAASPVLPPDLQQDNLQYLRLARDLSTYGEVGGIYAQRIVLPALVWSMNVLLGWDVVTGFRVLSVTAIFAFAFGVYALYRHLSLRPGVALAATLFVVAGSWPIVYGFSNVYQACDAMAYPLGLAFIVAIRSRRVWVALVVGAIGLGCRQQLLVLVVLGSLAALAATRQWRWLAVAGVHAALFGLLVKTAGQQGAEGLLAHVALSASTASTVLHGLLDSRLPVLLSPYLLVLVVFYRQVLDALRRYPWIALFALVTALQPLVAYPLTGPQNAARLAMIGLWPLVLLGGWIVGRAVQHTRWAWVFVLSPLLYGTAHLVSFPPGWASPLGHRLVVNGVLLVAMLAVTWHLGIASRAVPPTTSGR